LMSSATTNCALEISVSATLASLAGRRSIL
jgi:hypothetical protein